MDHTADPFSEDDHTYDRQWAFEQAYKVCKDGNISHNLKTIMNDAETILEWLAAKKKEN